MKNIKITKILLALLGILFVGIGVAFNASTKLGNDPIGIIYDGARNALNLTPAQLGIVSNAVNYTLIVLLFFIGRKYVNIGTLIYILPYGLFVDLGTLIYRWVFHSDQLFIRMIAGIIGSLLLYAGVSIYIAVNIGLDPFTGIVMVIRDHLKLDYKKVKIGFDVIMVIIGVLLGGTLGIITVFTAITAGPFIQWLSGKLTKVIKH